MSLHSVPDKTMLPLVGRNGMWNEWNENCEQNFSGTVEEKDVRRKSEIKGKG